METDAAAVPPRASGPRTYKVLVPWRFQRRFVRQPLKHAAATIAPASSGDGGGKTAGDASAENCGPGGAPSGGVRDAKNCGSDGAPSVITGEAVSGGERQSERCSPSQSSKNPDVNNGGHPVPGNACDRGDSGGAKNYGLNDSSGADTGVEAGEDCNLESSNCASSVKDAGTQDLGGISDGAASDQKSFVDQTASKSNAPSENCFTEGLNKSFVDQTASKSNAPSEKCFAEGLKKSFADQTASKSNAPPEKCFAEGLKKSSVDQTASKSNAPSGSDPRSEDPVRLGDYACHTAKECRTGDGAAKESDAAAKGFSLETPGSNGNGIYCRKGRKTVVPWRFQVGYKRSSSQAFASDNGSSNLPTYGFGNSSAQCTPATRSSVRYYASAHSGVRVSAMRDFSSGKGEKEAASECKKRKTNNDQDKAMPNNGGTIIRESVMRSLQDFRLIYRDLLDEEEENLKEEVLNVRPDLQAYRIFRERFSTDCDDKKYIGSVPGIYPGDIFHLRVELCVVGLHRPHRLGIDYTKKHDGTSVAISIVFYAQSSDIDYNLDVLVYSGSVAVTVNQKIEGTNLALKKSMDTNTPVRVILGFSTVNGKKKFPTYIYGGLYHVEKYWRVKEREDRYVYMFRLKRMEGQKHIDINEILQAGKSGSNNSIIIKDLSRGLEKVPVSVVNNISAECPMPYRYISQLQYPRNFRPTPPAGCGCVGGCSDSKKCACAVKNGGESPFNDKGRIIRAKPLVYECGPSCKCPPTCHNRVGQHGLKFRLQVFKTKSMGWGVRTLDFIPSGSFVCEYIGEVLEDEEAQKRTNDEYLFAIGHNYYDKSLWEGLSTYVPALQKGPGKHDEAGYAVDASEMGNFAKFINHSCTPNLYAQNVLYDHEDISAPRIMFFACDDIRPHQELAYHYNYKIDQVHDTNGNIKKKKCLCGSVECDGWLY